MPFDPVKKIFTGAAVHINSEPNMAVKETMPTKRFISIVGRPKCADSPSNTCTVPPVKCRSVRCTKTLISSDDTEYSTPMNSPETMITFTKARLPPFTSFTYTATDSAPPAAWKIQAVMPRNAQLKFGVIACTLIGSAGSMPPSTAAPARTM